MDQRKKKMNENATSEITEGFLYALFNFYVSGYYLDLKREKYYAIGQMTEYNDRYGSEDDWSGMDDYIRECVNEADQPLITEVSRIGYIRERLQREQSYSIEVRDHGTGAERWYRYTTMRGADADHAAISFMDVTDQVLQRQELERLTQAVKTELTLNRTLGIYSWRILVDEMNNMRCIEWSENACKFMRVPARPNQQASMRTLYNIIHPDLLPAFIMELQKTILDASGKYVFEFDNRQEMDDGTVKWFHCTGRLVELPNGKDRAIIGAFRDITDSYLVREERQELTEVHDLMQAARWTARFNYDGTVASIEFSDELRKSLGYENEEDFPNDSNFFRSIMHPDDVTARDESMATAVADPTGNAQYDLKYRLKRKDGEYLWVRSAIRIHRDEVGTAESAVGVLVDINDSVLKAETEEKLRQANEEQNAQLEEITALNAQLQDNQAKLEEAASEQEAQLEEIREEREKLSEAYGMIEGLSREYHTIWVVNKETSRMRLVRSSGKSTIQRAVRMGIDEPAFDPAFDNYIGSCVEPEDRERMHREIAFAEVLRHLNEHPDELYAVNYLRRDDSGRVGYHQIAFANADTADGVKQFVYGFRDVDQIVKEEQKQKEELQEALTRAERATAQQEAQFEQIQALNKALQESQEGAIRRLLAEFVRQEGEPADQLLKGVGRYFDAERSYIFETSEDGKLSVNTYKWCADGVQPEIQNLQALPISVVEPWYTAFREKGCFYLSCDSKYAEKDPAMYAVLEPQGISNLMAAPIVSEGKVIGFLGVDNPKRNTGHKLLLSIAASMIYHEIRIKRDHIKAENYRQELQRHIEEITQLNRTAAEYNDIMANAGYGMWHIILKDGAASRMQVNDKMAQLLGVAGQELSEEELYNAWYDRISPEAIPSVQASVGEMLAGSFSENTYRWIHPAKGAIYVRCGGTAQKLEDGTHVLSGYHADVTDIVLEEQRHNRELEEAKENAESANAAKTSFLFNMSHDIRTPMNAILGFRDLLEKHQEDPEKRQDYLNKIQESSTVLLSIINNVLEMARIEKGKLEIEEVAWSTEQFNDTLYSVFHVMMAEKGLNFTRQIDVQHHYVYCDPTKLREIFINILSNAYKYTNAGGSVNMHLEEIPSDREGWVLYRTTISDTGIGMSEEFLAHIFEEFSREHNTTEAKVEGTGLGMPIVKRLVELLEGTIEVESRKGEGSTFIVTVPHRIADRNDLVDHAAAKIDPKRFREKRILLAEDNDLNAEIATEILSEAGFIVDRAEDGRICVDMLEKAKAGFYDLILMDIQMPNMNGYEATKAIRRLEDQRKANIRIIAMTANAFEEDKREAFRAGMNGHLAKPINVNELMKTLAGMIK